MAVTREHRPVAGLCFWRNRPLTLFCSPFLLFGNRGLRPNLINFQGFLVRRRNFYTGLFNRVISETDQGFVGRIIPWTLAGCELLVTGGSQLCFGILFVCLDWNRLTWMGCTPWHTVD